MSAQACPSSPVSFAPPSAERKQAALPANSVFSPAQAVRQDRAAPFGSSFFGWLWSSYRKHRNVARLRNLAVEMDEHMLQDVGAPNWLINEAAVNRDLTQRRDVNYLRW